VNAPKTEFEKKRSRRSSFRGDLAASQIKKSMELTMSEGQKVLDGKGKNKTKRDAAIEKDARKLLCELVG